VRYEFLCTECPGTQPTDGKHVACVHEREIPISKAPPLGRKVKCPLCGRRTAIRIMSSGVYGIIKGQTEYNWRPGERMRTAINGQEVAFEFVDHKHTDPALQRNLSRMAGAAGITPGMGRARFDPKSGRVVVDIASNVRDPLGALQRSQNEAKKAGNYQQEVKKVNQPVKRRGNFHSPIPVGMAMRQAQAKRAAKK
jgi:hypothetical protein